MNGFKKICKICGKEYDSFTKISKYCSYECRKVRDTRKGWASRERRDNRIRLEERQNLLSEIMEKVKRMENTFAYKPIPINKNNIDVKNINKILKKCVLHNLEAYSENLKEILEDLK